jgi:LCP family protein required for cell wall assembly
VNRLFEPRSVRDAHGGADDAPAGEPTPRPATRRPSRSRRTRVLRWIGIGTAAVLLLISVAGVGTALWLQHHYDGNIRRFGDPFAGLSPTERPKGAAGAVNVLLLGSDTRFSSSDPDAWLNGAQTTDAVMLAHVPADRETVTIASLPKDAPVSIPGHGRGPLSQALRLGGPTLMVQTIEKQTGVRVNHLVILDFEGFRGITDDLGGVSVTQADGRPREMNGATALQYIRQSRSVPGQDVEEVRRQQAWIRAVTAKSLTKRSMTSPLTLTSVLDSLTRSISADEGFTIDEMRSLSLSLRKVQPDRLRFVTPPTGARGGLFWTAMATDSLPAWLAAHPGATVH